MVRKLLVVFALTALTLASCGRQVTPDRPGENGAGLQSGQMQINVTTQGQVDFVNNWYVLAFNLSCPSLGQQPCMPYAVNGNAAHNYQNWDFELVLAQPNGSSTVQPFFYQFVTVNGNVKQPYLLTNYNPAQDIHVNTNSNNSGTQFSVTFFRRIFNGVQNTGPNPTPAPSNGPTTPWYMNFFVASPQAGVGSTPPGQVIFAPGVGGLTDQTFTFPASSPGLDPTSSFDLPWTGLGSPPWMMPSNGSPSAQIIGGEVINNP